MIKVGIDAFSLNRRDSGIEVYTRELINGILTSYCVELYSYADIDFPRSQNLTLHSSRLAEPGSLKKLKWELLDISSLISPDTMIYHSPHFILPYNNPARRKVVTVHDLAFLRHPEYFDWKTRFYYRLFLKKSLQEADAIICISESCRNDVMEFFPETKEKTHLVYNGFKNYGQIKPDTGILKKLNLQSPYILMIGTLNDRKNLQGAVQAFQSFAKNRDLELVIVGSFPKEKLPVQTDDKRIRLTGFVSDAALSSLYQNAEVLLFPSFYEGFGFPILEAMSVGLPVLTSNVSSMPEISGYPGELLCDPRDVKSIEKLLHYFLSSENRDFLRRHGSANTAKFSWPKMVAETSAVYELLQKSI
jgi:glycosyltransferase involved in cell wall biosynthesis